MANTSFKFTITQGWTFVGMFDSEAAMQEKLSEIMREGGSDGWINGRKLTRAARQVKGTDRFLHETLQAKHCKFRKGEQEACKFKVNLLTSSGTLHPNRCIHDF